MISQKNLNLLKKQHYYIAGKHSVVQICRWTKKSLRNEGECYKQKFYGIKSHGCCELSPSTVWCDNKCLHCWRAIEATQGNKMNLKQIDSPEKIIEECIKGRKKLLSGFKGSKKTNQKKFAESLEPSHFAISLIGEPTLYSKIGEMISLLRKRRKTTFLVTNGLHPEKIKEMEKKKQLPTQLYVSFNSSNEKEYNQWHNSSMKNAWKKYNQTLDLLKKLKDKTRTILRMTLVKDINMRKSDIFGYAKLIKKTSPMFVEVVGFKSVGYARQRLAYETMPNMKEIVAFANSLAKAIGYIIADKHVPSRIILLCKNKTTKKRMEILPKEL